VGLPEVAMRCHSRVGLFLLALVTWWPIHSAGAAGPPSRKPLDARQREAVLLLIKAVDAAQEADAASDEALSWDGHILKSGDQTAYVPFRLTHTGAADAFASAVIYVRAVTRRGGMRASEEHSFLRDWLARGNDVPKRMGETVYVGPGEMPVGGPAAGSTRRSIAGPAEALAVLALQQREFDKQKAAAAEAAKKAETKERDPFRFAFEDYYLADTKSRTAGARIYERAMTLPPGEYDIFVGLLDRARAKSSSPAILKRTLVVPDFWDDRLAVSSLILAKAVTPPKGPLSPAQQVEHPYTLGRTEVVPVASPSFTTDEALSVVFQVSNYGAPDADLTIDYAFFRTDGARRLFNRTDAQRLSDDDLPPPGVWDTQAFAMQIVPLRSFPPGRYELEVMVKDRVTRATATGTVAFSVGSEVR
jgi:hypothetical protein